MVSNMCYQYTPVLDLHYTNLHLLHLDSIESDSPKQDVEIGFSIVRASTV